MVYCCNIFIHFNLIQWLNNSRSQAAWYHSMYDNITRKWFKSIIQYSLLIIFDWICTYAKIRLSLHVCSSVPASQALFPADSELYSQPQKAAPEGDSYSTSAVFPCVCLMRTVGFGDRSEGSGWTRPHGAPDCVDTVAYPKAWQQPLKRGATKMD